MPMLTGTLITAAGFLPIGLAKSTVGEYTFAIFAVTAAALLISWLVSVYFVPYLGTLLLKDEAARARRRSRTSCSTRRSTRASARIVDWCVRAPLDDDRRDRRRSFVLGIVGMGTVQQQFFPDSSRPEILVDLWFPEGTSFAANEAVTKRVEARMLQAARASTRVTHLGRQRRAALLPAARPDLPADQRSAADRACRKDLQGARDAARSACRRCSPTEFPGGARPRQAAAERAAGAVSGAVPRGRAGRRRSVRALRRRGQGDHARQPEHARRQRQLERVGQGAAPRRSTRTRRARSA